ncbi:hypothetical protein H6F75_00115 [Nodosilinea sp. FACHB-131]|uniref:hypothetical protein n=1 Tax=Cyanophyceae TaxID=3028117 RepID=UPI0016865E70|nr:hypothetical protein [Nodosilinea sp. FACHB-131]MBD1871874.1 hypothetical protein [Nodosilinea sp. FACHB-131]
MLERSDLKNLLRLKMALADIPLAALADSALAAAAGRLVEEIDRVVELGPASDSDEPLPGYIPDRSE